MACLICRILELAIKSLHYRLTLLGIGVRGALPISAMLLAIAAGRGLAVSSVTHVPQKSSTPLDDVIRNDRVNLTTNSIAIMRGNRYQRDFPFNAKRIDRKWRNRFGPRLVLYRVSRNVPLFPAPRNQGVEPNFLSVRSGSDSRGTVHFRFSSARRK